MPSSSCSAIFGWGRCVHSPVQTGKERHPSTSLVPLPCWRRALSQHIPNGQRALAPRCIHALTGGRTHLASKLIWLPTGPSLGPVRPYIGHVGILNMIRIFKALYVSQASQATFVCGFPSPCGQLFHPGTRTLYTGGVTTVA
jgi:hypothetical protein